MTEEKMSMNNIQQHLPLGPAHALILLHNNFKLLIFKCVKSNNI